MSNTISQVFSQPSPRKQTKYDLIMTISNSMQHGYNDLKAVISGGERTKSEEKQNKPSLLIKSNQITVQGEKRSTKWITKRLPKKN